MSLVFREEKRGSGFPEQETKDTVDCRRRDGGREEFQYSARSELQMRVRTEWLCVVCCTGSWFLEVSGSFHSVFPITSTAY